MPSGPGYLPTVLVPGQTIFAKCDPDNSTPRPVRFIIASDYHQLDNILEGEKMMRKLATMSGVSAIAIAISLGAVSANAAPWIVPGKVGHASGIQTVSTGYMKGYFDSETRYEIEHQDRGYQGGTETVYCSYRNEPKRVCKATGNGRETCRITGWTLIESCN